PENSVAHSDFGVALHGLAVALHSLGQYDEARRMVQEAAAHQRIAMNTVPAERTFRQLLANHLANIGFYSKRTGHWEDAERPTADALTMRTKLRNDFPDKRDYAYDLASSHNAMGTLLHEKEQHHLAEPYYRAAIALQEQLAAAYPTVPHYRMELA